MAGVYEYVPYEYKVRSSLKRAMFDVKSYKRNTEYIRGQEFLVHLA